MECDACRRQQSRFALDLPDGDLSPIPEPPTLDTTPSPVADLRRAIVAVPSDLTIFAPSDKMVAPKPVVMLSALRSEHSGLRALPLPESEPTFPPLHRASALGHYGPAGTSFALGSIRTPTTELIADAVAPGIRFRWKPPPTTLDDGCILCEWYQFVSITVTLFFQLPDGTGGSKKVPNAVFRGTGNGGQPIRGDGGIYVDSPGPGAGASSAGTVTLDPSTGETTLGDRPNPTGALGQAFNDPAVQQAVAELLAQGARPIGIQVTFAFETYLDCCGFFWACEWSESICAGICSTAPDATGGGGGRGAPASPPIVSPGPWQRAEGFSTGAAGALAGFERGDRQGFRPR